MKKSNLIMGILGGAAAGAAASYLMNSKDRKNLTTGITNLGSRAVGAVFGDAGEENNSGSSSRSKTKRSSGSSNSRKRG